MYNYFITETNDGNDDSYSSINFVTNRAVV